MLVRSPSPLRQNFTIRPNVHYDLIYDRIRNARSFNLHRSFPSALFALSGPSALSSGCCSGYVWCSSGCKLPVRCPQCGPGSSSCRSAHHVVSCHVMSRHGALRSAMLCRAGLCCAVVCCAMARHATFHHDLLLYFMLLNVISLSVRKEMP